MRVVSGQQDLLMTYSRIPLDHVTGLQPHSLHPSISLSCVSRHQSIRYREVEISSGALLMVLPLGGHYRIPLKTD